MLYGEKRDPAHLSVDAREFARHVRQHHKVFNLKLGGDEQAIYLQAVQWDCLTDEALHLDLLRIRLDQEMQIKAEIVFFGHAVGLARGGRMVQDVHDVALNSLPASIPDRIEVRVGDLDIGMSILAKELELPENVTLNCDPEAVICHMVAEKEEAPAEGEGETEGEGKPAE